MNKTIKSVLAFAGGLGATLAPTTVLAAEIPTITQSTDVDIVSVLQTIITYVLSFAGGIAVLYLIWAGIQYITGGAKGAQEAKAAIVNAIIGVVVIILSYVIVQVLITQLSK